MSNVTSSLRFPARGNCDYRKMAVNLVPFKNLTALLLAHAPMEASPKETYDAFSIVDSIWNSKNFLASVRPEGGPHTLSVSFICQNKKNRWEIHDRTLSIPWRI